MVFLVGCNPAEETDNPGTGVETTLAGTEWSLVSLNGEELITGTTITLSLEDDYLGGEMGCNGYGNSFDSGKYTAMSDGSFMLEPPLAVTVQFCEEPEGIMEQESAYIDVLMNVAGFQIIGTRLKFVDETGNIILVYESK
jgi:heat shock protein HslJ